MRTEYQQIVNASSYGDKQTIQQIHTSLLNEKMKLDKFFSLFLDKFEKKMDPEKPDTPVWQLYKTKRMNMQNLINQSEQLNTIYKNLNMFKTANEFSLYIEQLVKEKKLSYMDAVLDYCKENFLEPEDVAKLINKSLKEKIALDMQELNYLPKTAKLDDV